MSSITDFSDEAQYNIKTVCERTGVRAVTLRAWERRYGILTPQRSTGNYRLYSEQDVVVVRWLKWRVDEGLAISDAATELDTARRTGQWPTLPAWAEPPTERPPVSHYSPEPYAGRLFESLVKRQNENAALVVLREAQQHFDLMTLCTDILIPCLVEIGEGWQRGEIRIATEHFASNFLRGRLFALYQSYPVQRGAPHVIVGCAPYERHEIGSLMLALLLRREKLWVEFLGADVHLDDLFAYARVERLALICLSAGFEESLPELRRVQAGLAHLRPRPKFGFGGRLFNLQPALRATVPGVFLGETLQAACATVKDLLN